MTEREVETVERKDEIVSGKTFLGIEFGSTPVSYTHLDVYKRQELDIAGGYPFLQFLLCNSE